MKDKPLTKNERRLMILQLVHNECADDYSFIEEVINAATSGVRESARRESERANLSEAKSNISLGLLITKFMRKKRRIEQMDWIVNVIDGKPACGVEKDFLEYARGYKEKYGKEI